VSRLYHLTISITHRMFKTATVLTHPPQRAKTRISPNKAAASEETRRRLRYVEALSDARTTLEEFSNILSDANRQRGPLPRPF
jgi:hypothetical protein